MAPFAVFVIALISPFIVLVGAFGRALVLFWPTMLLLGAAHSHIAAIPALGWTATFFVVALLSVLIPTGSSTTTSE